MQNHLADLKRLVSDAQGIVDKYNEATRNPNYDVEHLMNEIHYHINQMIAAKDRIRRSIHG